MAEEKKKLLGLSLADLEAVAAEMAMPRFTAKQMAQWLYEKRATTVDEMTNLSKSNRARLSERYCVGREAPAEAMRSVDGTVKYLFRTAGGKMIESVYIPDADRATLCVSSQIGCKMNCSFCMTGKQGYHGDLTAAEILNQIFSIPESLTLTNIVFMGMGEPMDNYIEVVRAIAVLTERWGLAWSPKRITVSSIGKLGDLKPHSCALCTSNFIFSSVSSETKGSHGTQLPPWQKIRTPFITSQNEEVFSFLSFSSKCGFFFNFSAFALYSGLKLSSISNISTFLIPNSVMLSFPFTVILSLYKGCSP